MFSCHLQGRANVSVVIPLYYRPVLFYYYFQWMLFHSYSLSLSLFHRYVLLSYERNSFVFLFGFIFISQYNREKKIWMITTASKCFPHTYVSIYCMHRKSISFLALFSSLTLSPSFSSSLFLCFVELSLRFGIYLHYMDKKIHTALENICECMYVLPSDWAYFVLHSQFISIGIAIISIAFIYSGCYNYLYTILYIL